MEKKRVRFPFTSATQMRPGKTLFGMVERGGKVHATIEIVSYLVGAGVGAMVVWLVLKGVQSYGQ